MPERRFTVEQIGSIVRELRRERMAHDERLKVRRMLIEMSSEAKFDDRTGTFIPAPFDRSRLIIKTLTGEVVQGVQHFTTRIAANPPVVSVVPIAGERDRVTKTAEERSAEEERLLQSQWQSAGGRRAQWQATWSAVWGRVGWYFTLPRAASWGLPERTYFDDLTDDEIDALKRQGKAVQIGDRVAEPAASWLERRRASAKGNAVSGRSLFTLEALPPDVVYTRLDNDSENPVKYGAVIQEVPAADFQPGEDYARELAKLAGIPDEDASRYGFYVDQNGRIQGGVTQGGEPGSKGSRGNWTLTRFVTRDEVYYVVSTTPETVGTIVYHDHHGAGTCPLVPLPGMLTDSGKPGAEYSSPMEAVFAYAPILNQIETLLSNVASWNALGRFVVEDADGNLIRDPETQEPIWIGTQDAVGLDPKDVSVVGGRIRQLEINADLLVKLLEFYSAAMEGAGPPPVSQGEGGGSSTPAWTVRQLLLAAQESLRETVDNSAAATAQVMRIWLTWMRQLDEPIYMFAAPGARSSAESRRGLIEFDPADLVESIVVTQDSNTASDRVVLLQSGLELWQAGVIDDLQFFEEYALEEDAEEAVIRMRVQQVKAFVLTGDTSQLQPGSLLWNVAQAVRGRVALEMMERVPNFALAAAEQMAARANVGSQLPTDGGGNPAAANGIRQPGVNAPLDQPGSPDGALLPVGPTPVGVGR